MGRLKGRIDVIVIEYDDLGNKTQLDDPDKGLWQYRHNALGELICQIDAEGYGVRLDHDERGRMIERVDLANVVSIDPCEGVELGSTTWTYENRSGRSNFGRLRSEQSTDGGVSVQRGYEYDRFGREDRVVTTISDYEYLQLHRTHNLRSVRPGVPVL
jgi:YD repeat-containing protein